jgi:hypothetical protein
MRMDVPKNRRANLVRIVAEDFGGVIRAFAAKIDRDEAYAWQLLNAKKRNVGEKIARHIEGKLGLRPGALDVPPDTSQPRIYALAIDSLAPPAAQESLALYGMDPELQKRILQAFDKLTSPQQEHYLQLIEADVKANIEIARVVGPKLRHAPDEKVASYIPPAPKTHRRTIEDRPADMKQSLQRRASKGDE